MKQRRCKGCSGTFPSDELERVEGQLLCTDCSNKWRPTCRRCATEVPPDAVAVRAHDCWLCGPCATEWSETRTRALSATWAKFMDGDRRTRETGG